ncbi:MAG: WYL domain-containing protein, partial [Polyangiaceae bacterium]|nr:WYL domain-containing protein [Polyangiaceae bacterium]
LPQPQNLPEEVTIDPNLLDGFLSVDLGPLPAPDACVFAELARALTQRRRVRMRYASASSGRTTDRTVDPYRVFNLRGTWYLAAYDRQHAAVRDFALHRIRKLEMLDERYRIDPAFDFRRYMADAFSIEKGGKVVKVAVRFAPRQARWIRECKWHATASVQDRLDGGCVLRMQVAGLGEVKRWIMQFGAEAEVLSPASLRREVAAEMRAAARQYRLEIR